jgi:hypothetical protein
MAEDLDDDHGDNGGDASPDVYLEYVRLQVLDEVAKQSIMGRMRARTKQAKDDGIDVDADAIVKKLAKLDPDTRAARMQNARKQAAWRGLAGFSPGVDPNAEQTDIWPEPSADIKQGHRDAVIYSDGANSRRAGGDRHENTQMAGSRDYQTWDQAWLDTDRDIMGQPAAPKAASTERKPRAKKAAAPANDADNDPTPIPPVLN